MHVPFSLVGLVPTSTPVRSPVRPWTRMSEVARGPLYFGWYGVGVEEGRDARWGPEKFKLLWRKLERVGHQPNALPMSGNVTRV